MSLIMDFLQGIAQPFETLGKGLINTPEAIAREIQNKPITDIQQKTFGTTNQGQIARDIIGSTANVGLDIAAPGIGRAAAGVASPAIGAATEAGGAIAGGITKGAVEGAAIGGPQSVAQGVTSNKPLNAKNLTMDFLQGAGEGAALGGVGGAGAEAFKNRVPLQAANQTGGVGSDVNPLSDETAQAAAKEQDPQKVEKILGQEIGPISAKDTAPAVATTSQGDPAVVQKIVKNDIAQKISPATPDATDIANPSPSPAPLPPTTPVSNINTPEQVAGQGSAAEANFINTPGEERQMSTVMQEGAKQVPEISTTPTDVPQKGLGQSVQASPNFSPELKENIGSPKEAVTNAQTNANTQEFMKQGIDNAHGDVLGRLQSGKIINAQLTSDAGAVFQHFDALSNQAREAGDEASANALQAKASNVHNLLEEGLEAQGQGAQAARLILNRSPEGLYYDATNTLNKNGGKVPPEVDAKLQDLKNELKNTIPGTPEWAKGVQDMGKIVRDNTPSTLGEKAFGIWRAGLLTSGQILPKVAVSHGVQAIAELASKAIAAPIDKFISNFGFSTGERSLSATLKGGEGFKTGLSKAKDLVTKGVDSGIGSNSQEDFGHTINYGNSLPGKFLGAYVNGVGRLHGAIYQPFAEYFHANSLWDQAITRAKNQGLQGEEKDRFLVDFMHSPPYDAMDIALHDAKVGSFQQETKLGQIASTIQQKGGPLGKVVAPFTKIPSAIATDLFNYSPAGAMKTIVDGIKAAKTEDGWSIADQRNFAQGLGRSIVGTAAIVPGVMLYNRGLMTLGYPTDPKEQQLWQDEGKIPNAVKVGGQWRNLASLGPMGNVLSMGGGIADSLVQGKDIGTALLNGFTTGAQSIAQASYLQGSSQLINTINDPARNATTFAKSLAGSIIPAGVNSAATATDPLQRQTTGNNLFQSALQSIQSRIPGERESLAPKVDAFGNPLKSGETGLEKAIDPFNSSNAVTPGPLLSELRRLQNAGFGEMPAAVTKKENFGSTRQPENATLTRQQMQQLTTMIGQTTEQGWYQAINSPGYAQLPDIQKQAILAQIYGSSAQQEKSLFAQLNQLGPYSSNVQQTITQSKQKRVQVV